MRFAAILILSLFAIQTVVFAQHKKKFPNFDSINSSKGEKINHALFEEGEELNYKLENKKIAYEIDKISLRGDVFRWNHLSSQLIFWMVIIIVFLGLVFSAIQFYISMIAAKSSIDAVNTAVGASEEKPASSTVKISMSGIEVNSSVLGIIILVIALAFLYLYLIYVYPVKEFNVDQSIEQKQLNETMR